MTEPRTTILFAAGATDLPVRVAWRRVRCLSLRVRADGSAHMSVPWNCSGAVAQRFLDARAAWLRECVSRRRAEAEPAADGLVPLWGALVPLPNGIAPDDLWRRELAARLPEVAPRMETALGVRAAGWQLRSMTSRWGSCTPATRRIRVNVRLAAYPTTCLDYVVAHELAHLIEPSHNTRFHELLARAYPDERAARALLRRDPRELAEGAARNQPRNSR